MHPYKDINKYIYSCCMNFQHSRHKWMRWPERKIAVRGNQRPNHKAPTKLKCTIIHLVCQTAFWVSGMETSKKNEISIKTLFLKIYHYLNILQSIPVQLKKFVVFSCTQLPFFINDVQLGLTFYEISELSNDIESVSAILFHWLWQIMFLTNSNNVNTI